jgi:methionyl-tRNA synthetase
LFNRGEKMSKSVGNVIDPFSLADHYGVDQLRYFFMREVPFGQDGNYSHEAIVNRINADLANDLGNLAQRSLSMIAKNLDGKMPKLGELLEQDRVILGDAYALADKARKLIQDFALHHILADIWRVVADANRYFAGEEPWAKRKTDLARFETILAVTIETLRLVGLMTQPFMPQASSKLLDLLSVDRSSRDFTFMKAEARVEAGTLLPTPQAIFPRYVENEGELTN